MPPFGAHFSVAGGMINAVKTAVRFECPTLQLFTKNASQWKASPITDDVAKEFKAAVKQAKLKQLAAHDSYLINLAAPGDELFEKSIATYAARARSGSITMEELIGGTFTITNGGVFGSLLSTPIVNAPQSAILGMHKIQDRPIAIDGQVVVRPMMYIALTYDHRIIDGREAVQFLVTVKQILEDPARLVLGV